ncbi:hypothetical protein FKM82_012299 [Ascaphus truei]
MPIYSSKVSFSSSHLLFFSSCSLLPLLSPRSASFSSSPCPLFLHTTFSSSECPFLLLTVPPSPHSLTCGERLPAVERFHQREDRRRVIADAGGGPWWWWWRKQRAVREAALANTGSCN